MAKKFRRPENLCLFCSKRLGLRLFFFSVFRASQFNSDRKSYSLFKSLNKIVGFNWLSEKFTGMWSELARYFLFRFAIALPLCQKILFCSVCKYLNWDTLPSFKNSHVLLWISTLYFWLIFFHARRASINRFY